MSILNNQSIKVPVIVWGFTSYDMGDNRGVSVYAVGNKYVGERNKGGYPIVETPISDYSELSYIRTFEDRFPCVFLANQGIKDVKLANGSKKSGVVLSNLEFQTELDLIEKKQPVVK